MGSTGTVERALIGRADELARMGAFIDEIDETGALFLEGEPGIGKTSMWNAGLELARDRAVHVLTARPGETERELSFATLGDLLAGVTDVLGALPEPQRRALRIALLLEPEEGAPPDARAIGAAFLGCLRTLSESQTVIVAVDDLQWADRPSVAALEFAFRRLHDEPVGLLATVRIAREERRPVELDRALANRLTRLTVEPMSVAALYELIATQVGLRVSRPTLLRIHETAGGNPFFALELARALQSAGVEPRPGNPLPVPDRLRDVVRARLAGLSPPSAETLLFAAAVARPSLALVESALGDAARAERDVREAEEAGVIDLDAGRIRFSHPLLASIHYSASSPKHRRRVHRRLTEVVDDLEERARHLMLAVEGPDETVASALAKAASHAHRRGATVAAAELAEQALRLTPSGEPATSRRRLIDAATLQYAAGDTQSALALLDEGLRATPAGAARAELPWTKGKVSFEAEHTNVGLDLFREALDVLGEADDLLRARILVDLASAGSGGQETVQRSRQYAAEAVELARQAEDRVTLARALSRLGGVKFWCGEGLAVELFEEAMALEESVGGLELDYGPTVSYARAIMAAGDFAAARPLLERLCRHGRLVGDSAVNMTVFLLGHAEYCAGNWDRAAELAQEAQALNVQSGREAGAGRGLYLLATIKAARGEIEEARRLGEAALVITDSRGWKSGGPRGALGLLELSLENYEVAYDAMMPAIERYESLGMVNDLAFDAVEALAELGRSDEAQALLARTEARIEGLGAWVAAGAARARGHLELGRGDLEASEEQLEEAVERWEATGSPPFELGRTLLTLGTVRRRAGKKRAAHDTLERALAIFEDLGARIWAERARKEAARIGGRSAPRTKLSATEAEIAALVAAGKTNNEVARTLHLSPKTVEWNLSKIYRKLGVRSRAELAARR